MVVETDEKTVHETNETIIPSTDEAQQLSREVREIVEEVKLNLDEARSENTRRAYASDWADFERFCAEHKLQPLPAKVETVAMYLSDRARRYAWATVERRKTVIGIVHKRSGYDNPVSTPLIQEVVRGIKRRYGVQQRRVKPLLPDMLRQAAPILVGDLRGIRDLAVLSLGIAGAFRRSEIVALDVDDVRIEKRGLVIRMRRSKTDQFGAGTEKAIRYGKNPLTCPVRAWKRWRAEVEIEFPQLAGEPGFPAFLVVKMVHGQPRLYHQRMSTRAVADAVKRVAELVGEDPADYSGHSARAGFVTAAIQHGVPLDRIMAQTGHRQVKTVQKYIRRESIWEDNATESLGL